MTKIDKVLKKISKRSKRFQTKSDQRKRLAIITVSIFSVLAIFIIGAFTLTNIFKTATPGTSIAGIDITGKTEREIRAIVSQLSDKIGLNLIHNNKTVFANADDLGININIEQTANNAIRTARGKSNSPNSNPLEDRQVYLVVQWNENETRDFINERFSELVVEPKNAEILFNENKFEVMPGKTGKKIDTDIINEAIIELLSKPNTKDIEINVVEAQPTVNNATANSARDFVNERLNLMMNINYNGNNINRITPSEIASWVTFDLDTIKNEFNVRFDEEKITDSVNRVASLVSVEPINQRAFVGSNGQTLHTVSGGRNGRQVTNANELVEQIKTALNSNTPIEASIRTAEKPFGTDSILAEGDRWVSYNKSTFTVKLHVGDQVVWSSNRTAHGRPQTPTITGAFRVTRKVASDTMTGGSHERGDFYHLTDIRWVVYFEATGYAFHTARWLPGQEHTRISRGCINMHEHEAKLLYDFVSVGTPIFISW